ncbi:MAG: Cobalt transporter ATP-binding protein [Aeromicrobium sp.]|nr:Cobalt transporter ATP-binding protein [Aeromicrobium sp.]
MPTISFDDVTVRVRGADGDIVILRPTSLTLTEQRIGLIGSNGSGKSTLARLVNGLVEASSGTVTVDGLDVARKGAEVRRQVAFTFTDPAAQLVMPTCVEDVEMSLRRVKVDKNERRAMAIAVLRTYGLDHLADTSVHALSGGQKQLLALAGVLATRPRIVVADEPTTLLDLVNTRRVADLLFGLEQQLLLVTHDLELAARCDRVLVIEDAAVQFDGPARDAIAFYRHQVGA